MPLVSLFVCSLSSNPIIRAAPIACALQRIGFDVEILGFVEQEKGLYPPYAKTFNFKTLPLSPARLPSFRQAKELASLASGDVCYAFKPRVHSLLPAVIASNRSRKKPLLLDNEDDDLSVTFESTFTRLFRACKLSVRQGLLPVASMALHRMHSYAEEVTVSTSILQKYYGGTIVLHGPDETKFNPDEQPESCSDLRIFFNLPSDKKLLLFAGKPSPHKGLGMLTKTLEDLRFSAWELALAGDPQWNEFQSAKERLGERCHLVGWVDYDKMPGLLHAVDIVPVLQRNTGYAQAQLPAKLLEAMAMAKGVIASQVGDLPRIVGTGEAATGWLVPPNDTQALKRCLADIDSNPQEFDRRRIAARDYFRNYASVEANSKILRDIFCSNPKLKCFVD